jgi:hypothetical protein
LTSVIRFLAVGKREEGRGKRKEGREKREQETLVLIFCCLSYLVVRL